MKAALALLLSGLAVTGCGNASTAELGDNTTAQAGAAFAPLPALTGRVVDNAMLLPEALERDLSVRLAALERQTTDQFVVVTVVGLNGEPIESFARRLGNTWGIGQKGQNNGVLLVVAPKEKKVRIEVGTGLERSLTDASCSDILDKTVLPAFREGRMETGIIAGADAVIEKLNGAPPPPIARVSTNI